MRTPTPDEQSEISEHVRRTEGARAFGFLRTRAGAKRREVLLGETSSPAMIDWRTAPLAEAFFGCAEGEPFELESDGRTIEGEVEARALYGFDRGALVDIERPEKRYRRDASGAWTVLEGPPPLLLLPAKTRRRVDPIDVALDAKQRRVVELPADRSVLVLGEAGFGKTTAALHRLAAIARSRSRSRSLDEPLKALVIVPTVGLVRLSKLLLARLQVDSVEVATFDDWILREARRVFAHLPRRTSVNGTAAVLRLKRHPALRALLPAIAAQPVARPRQSLLHLFGDRALMEDVVARASGAVPRHAVREVLEHTRVQFSATTEEEHAHVDADRLVTVDGRRIDEGTPNEDAVSMDPEDGAVLFELHRLRAGSDATKRGRLSQYDLILIDEAQERAPIELAILGRARRRGGSIIVSGDERQQTDDTAYFPGWTAAMQELGAEDHERVVLTESHRSPPEVTRFARAMLGGKPLKLEAAKKRKRLLLARFPSGCHLEARLIEELRSRRARDPLATIGILCRDEESARRHHATLSRTLAIELVLDGAFSFRPGIVLTPVAEVKGLEFDVAVIPDADAARYPDTPEARRALYVAVTRAIDQVWIAAGARLSPIIEAMIASKLQCAALYAFSQSSTL